MAEEDGFEPSVPLGREVLKGRTSRRGGSFFAGGTEGSNPSSSSGESAANSIFEIPGLHIAICPSNRRHCIRLNSFLPRQGRNGTKCGQANNGKGHSCCTLDDHDRSPPCVMVTALNDTACGSCVVNAPRPERGRASNFAGDSASAERSAGQHAHPHRAFRFVNRCVFAQS